jgi:hypothetical protein
LPDKKVIGLFYFSGNPFHQIDPLILMLFSYFLFYYKKKIRRLFVFLLCTEDNRRSRDSTCSPPDVEFAGHLAGTSHRNGNCEDGGE